MEKIFDDKVALITGASFGIGQATALAFAKRGARVVLADWIEDPEQNTQKLIREAGGKPPLFVRCDVSNPADTKALLDEVRESFGRLDFAFNNAGIEGTQAPTQDCTPDNWNKTIAINLTGVWLCMKEELHLMIKQGSGCIVNCASIAGLVGFPGLPAYVASKHAVVGLTKTAALENAKTGIRINAVCPGVIRTDMIDRVTGKDPAAEAQFTAMEPVGRMGNPSEIAEAVVWLCSDGASFVTGHSMPVDGGFVAQ